MLFMAIPLNVKGDVDLPTEFSNIGGISNTRHNLTQSTAAGNTPDQVASIMGPFRNNYNQVCVYCHTPHAANSNPDVARLPLWNRTHLNNTYTTYDTLGTASLTQQVNQPGVNSLSCLSCHDGTLPVDSIINMPGSGGYDGNQQTNASATFLNTWTNTVGNDATAHMSLDADSNGSNNVLGTIAGGSCMACHSPGAGAIGAGATDFTVFSIGTDLTNDHPVGVTLPPNGPGTDFNSPTGVRPDIQWFELGAANARPDSNEIRFYDSRVECASCHDPHGVPSNGPGSVMNPSFLRVSNEGSGVCLTCHVK